SEKSAGGWGKPKNLGDVINTPEDEKFVFIHPNGKTLYFASNGHQCMGSYDIFKTEFLNGQWSIPVNLGYPINTVNEESTFSLTKDNQTMLIAAEYDDTYGERDIYSIDVSSYPLISAGYESSGYGTVVLEVKDEEGKPWKGEEVQFVLKETGRVITTRKSDRAGLVRVNLPGAQTYIAKFTDGDQKKEVEISVVLDPKKPVVIKEVLQGS
ncbi:MAG: PD40 domain-containing protein, partial [Flavobacteriales bacterium]|nr:PD40 domain-containing protein [Flavobacteriales bacterium]